MTSLMSSTAQPVPAGAVVHWGFLTVTMGNLVMVLAMVVVFILAVLIPFPGPPQDDRP